MRRLLITLSLMAAVSLPAAGIQKDGITDTQRLGMAIDYFAGGKYHEALTLLVRLDKTYRLNPRFKAYIGVCYYHEWNFVQACRYLDEVMPHIEIYAPHERSIYYGAAAESHFAINEYSEAIPLYEKQLLVCYDNEKGDALYRLGFCYMFEEKFGQAAEYFRSALAYYNKYPKPDNGNRIEQIGNMIKGCEDKAEKTAGDRLQNNE